MSNIYTQTKHSKWKETKKWNNRTRIRINFSYLSRHTHFTSFILNIQTKLTSPQFYYLYNDLFKTTRASQTKFIPKSLLQSKIGLSTQQRSNIIKNKAQSEVSTL